MKSLINATTALVLLTCLSTIHAEESNTESLKQYDIEVIIFEDAHARYLDSESWPVNESDTISVGEADISKSKPVLVKKELSVPANENFTPLKPEMLARQYNSLKRSSEFKVLFRSAWRQIGLAKNDAFEIDIGDLTNTHVSKSKNSIAGTLKIVLARYLHFYSQLEYQRHIEADSSADNQVNDDKTGASKVDESQANEAELPAENNLYAIQSHRRMRSKELHYIDHPLLGILIQINPVEVKEKPEELKSE